MQAALLTWVQFRAFGSKSSTLVICLRKSDSCIPGLAPLLLNRARGFDRITCRFTAKPAINKIKKSSKQIINLTFKLKCIIFYLLLCPLCCFWRNSSWQSLLRRVWNSCVFLCCDQSVSIVMMSFPCAFRVVSYIRLGWLAQTWLQKLLPLKN